MSKTYYRLSKAARYLDTSPDVLARWIMRGFLRAGRVKRNGRSTLLVTKHNLDVFAASRRRLERGVHISCAFSPMRLDEDEEDEASQVTAEEVA